MNVDHILSTLNSHAAEYVLIGGMNFFIVHQPVTTFDVDVWIDDTDENLPRVHAALAELSAEVSFSPRGEDWRVISALSSASWLRRAVLFCLNSPHGAIDVFRSVAGLEEGYGTLSKLCPMRRTGTGVPFRSLTDELMIRCQLALPEMQRKQDRLRALGYTPTQS